jgi:hypothetical protein
MGWKISYCWDEFLIEGDESFNCMITNFESMFDGETKIKHFYIKNEFNYDIGTNEIKEQYGEDIEKELIPWIKHEMNNKELCKKENWKPFRDRWTLSDMYLGYKKMFNFKEYYYFQLIVENYCQEKACNFCKNNDEDDDKNDFVFFALSFYGWTDNKHITLQPDDKAVIMEDNIMPEYYWDRE